MGGKGSKLSRTSLVYSAGMRTYGFTAMQMWPQYVYTNLDLAGPRVRGVAQSWSPRLMPQAYFVTPAVSPRRRGATRRDARTEGCKLQHLRGA